MLIKFIMANIIAILVIIKAFILKIKLMNYRLLKKLVLIQMNI